MSADRHQADRDASQRMAEYLRAKGARRTSQRCPMGHTHPAPLETGFVSHLTTCHGTRRKDIKAKPDRNPFKPKSLNAIVQIAQDNIAQQQEKDRAERVETALRRLRSKKAKEAN